MGILEASAARWRSAGTSQAEASECLSDLCSSVSICGSSLSAPKAKVYNFRKAVVHRMAGQPAEAKGTWRRILTLKRPEQFCSVDQGIYGHLTLRNLAALAQERGDPGEARRLWKSILRRQPRAPVDIEAYRRSSRGGAARCSRGGPRVFLSGQTVRPPALS